MGALAGALNHNPQVQQLSAMAIQTQRWAVVQRLVRVAGVLRTAQQAPVDEVRAEARRQTRDPNELDAIEATYRQWVAARRLRSYPTLAAMVAEIRARLDRTRTLASRERVSSITAERPLAAEIGDQQATGTQGQTPGTHSQETGRRTTEQRPVEQTSPLSQEQGRGDRVQEHLPLDRDASRDEADAHQGRQADHTSLIPSMPDETHTRVGFEVEIGGYYIIPRVRPVALEPVINRTLATCSVGGREILQMLIDDPRRFNVTGTRVQVEFRTPPLEFEDITQQLGTRAADSVTVGGGTHFPLGNIHTNPPNH